MRQVRGTQQAGSIRSPPDRISRLVFEQKQFVLQATVVSLLRHDFFLQCKCTREFHSAKPTHTEKIRGCRNVHRTTYDPQTALQDAILSSPRHLNLSACVSLDKCLRSCASVPVGFISIPMREMSLRTFVYEHSKENTNFGFEPVIALAYNRGVCETPN